MNDHPQATTVPTRPIPSMESSVSPRIEGLDLIRGIAALGILVMNSIAFGLDDAAYSNLEQGGNSTSLDTAIGVLARVFVDQKMMALFSLLFGVGVVIFADRRSRTSERSGPSSPGTRRPTPNSAKRGSAGAATCPERSKDCCCSTGSAARSD